jgi:hypothetical protein
MVLMALVVIFGHYMDFYNLIMFEPNSIEKEESHKEAKVAMINDHNTVLYAQAEHGTSDSKLNESSSESKPSLKIDEQKGKDHVEQEGEHLPTHYAGLGFPELTIFLGFVGLFLFWVFNTLSKASLVPTNDAYLKESMNHHI